MRSFEARISGRLVRTFSDRDLAERYREHMAQTGAVVELTVSRIARKAA